VTCGASALLLAHLVEIDGYAMVLPNSLIWPYWFQLPNWPNWVGSQCITRLVFEKSQIISHIEVG
jgi:hypothetical protein